MRRFFKHLGLALAGMAVLGGLLGAWIWFATREPDRVARSFVAAWAAGEHEATLALTTPGFRIESNAGHLAAAAQRLGLGPSATVEWNGISISGSIAQATAMLVHAADRKLPLQILQRRQDGEWRVHAVALPRAGLTIAPGDGWPDESELAYRTRVLVHTLAAESRSGHFPATYALMASDFQSQFDQAGMDAAFAAFADPAVNLTVLDRYPPEFEQLWLDDGDRVLRVRGAFRTRPFVQQFHIGWVHQGLSVRPIALRLQSVQP